MYEDEYAAAMMPTVAGEGGQFILEPERFEGVCEEVSDNTSPGDDSASSVLAARAHESASSPVDSDDGDGEADDCQLSMDRGRGVTVVREGGRDADGAQFELDEAALAELLLRPGVAARPVALVSVAGAFRGGKSFLLDFMLRYLYAEESARADGSWLGAPEEPLRGFSWRGGCQRETTGLVLWSQPFHVKLPDGRKVVVLLMDTQGSFDDKSSMRDCSLIFALSTLLSSVQVYNLSQRINESDLQHLQLFTDHAAAGGGALQALQLLVRDWSAPGDFPYGVAGGADYLRHQLQVHAEQPRELSEVRERLTSSFERVECCLLPHPGLHAATDPAFSGQLTDMTEEFKASLREFVPLVLSPSRLRVKKVDGRVLRARDLALHLRAYLETFRHHVPSPQSIGRAVATARWLAAAAAARARLRAHAPGRAAPARPRAELRERLTAARRAAADCTEPLAVRAGDEKGFANLEKELDDLEAEYIDDNEKKIALAVASARERWERLTAALRSPALCAPERDLREDVAAARAAAAARFDERVAAPEEPERAQLVQDLERRGAVLLLSACAASERNHAAAGRLALAALRDLLPAACLHPADLAAAHAAAARAARAALCAARTSPARHDPDPHLENLDERITAILRNHEALNAARNGQAVSAAQQLYDASMELGEQCRHPADLAGAHARAAQRAVAELRGRRRGLRAADTTDTFGEQLEKWIEDRYAVFMRMNTCNNVSAVEDAYDVFCARMDAVGITQLSAAELAQQLADAVSAAKETFKSKRLSDSSFGVDDLYYNQLEEKIRDSLRALPPEEWEEVDKSRAGGRAGGGRGRRGGAGRRRRRRRARAGGLPCRHHWFAPPVPALAAETGIIIARHSSIITINYVVNNVQIPIDYEY
ncbi:uncharacterized protein LOC133534193 [Cydia pomonella]|uniref:uncharacterized protein LOC133534193 n=1 Tax=Cydia pomonella TaxID=82600 RepID=UPI002ADD3FE9|nr:uncharacterized protein LOC133534193 [Cydia pomonella]